MIGVPLATDGDKSYVVAVVAEAVEEATVVPEAVDERRRSKWRRKIVSTTNQQCW